MDSRATTRDVRVVNWSESDWRVIGPFSWATATLVTAARAAHTIRAVMILFYIVVFRVVVMEVGRSFIWSGLVCNSPSLDAAA